MSRVTAAKTSAMNSRMYRGTGVKPESVLSGNGGMDAAVLSPRGAFTEKKNNMPVDILTTSMFPSPTPARMCRKILRSSTGTSR